MSILKVIGFIIRTGSRGGGQLVPLSDRASFNNNDEKKKGKETMSILRIHCGCRLGVSMNHSRLKQQRMEKASVVGIMCARFSSPGLLHSIGGGGGGILAGELAANGIRVDPFLSFTSRCGERGF